MKFLFNLQTQTLKVEKGEYWLILPEETQFYSPYRGIGFRLGDYNHWINFTLANEKVFCFYKVPYREEFVYYKREINRPLSGIIEFEFSEWDRIEWKRGGWVKVKRAVEV